MIKMVEMDSTVPIREQLGEAGREPVLLVNVFHAPTDKVDALMTAWADDANYFKSQPGFISAQLHRGIAGSRTFMNYAVWESVDAFRAAFTNPAFQAKLAAYPEGTTVSPHLFRKVAVSGLCVA